MTNKEVFDLVADFGVTMLSNGGELSRTKATMENVAKHYNIKKVNTYIIANGVFVTGETPNKETFITKVTDVPISPTNLCRVEAINDLSRKIALGNVKPEEAKKELEKIKTLNPYKPWLITLATGVGSAAFCYIFKGTLYDCLACVPVGILLNLFLMLLAKNKTMPKIVTTIFAGALVAVLCCLSVFCHFGNSVNSMIIGCIMPLVPGIPLTNAIRHFCDNDYLSGVIRLVDAVITAVSIAVGVGIVLMMWQSLIGGIL
ncbi:MAG: threonine/serine exporter family protein [Oscillospiraceae bacterium]